MLGNSLMAAQLAASQEGPSSIKLVSESQIEVNSIHISFNLPGFKFTE
jgi:hypothetical protein